MRSCRVHGNAFSGCAPAGDRSTASAASCARKFLSSFDQPEIATLPPVVKANSQPSSRARPARIDRASGGSGTSWAISVLCFVGRDAPKCPVVAQVGPAQARRFRAALPGQDQEPHQRTKGGTHIRATRRLPGMGDFCVTQVAARLGEPLRPRRTRRAMALQRVCINEAAICAPFEKGRSMNSSAPWPRWACPQPPEPPPPR